MKTLDEFIASNSGNEYVKEPGFSSLYVRKGPRYLDGVRYDNVLDIANVTARKKGKGTFTALITRLRNQYPDMPIYIENVLNERLVAYLPKIGFISVPDSFPPCFFVLNNVK